ncbi:hypothetical protein [Brevibacillus laterosporus]|uniref:hypothetical protein n=1 Tax=Brevibacillus laterosporus TaxID=1465 RepID=UPI0018CDAB39|nr:hypothetical protein [Brevibacillus laterosporus]MBG9789540.1 hypothetical protein [Brevibacillus laterosporus]
MSVEIAEVISTIQDTCRQTAYLIKQAQKQVKRASESRARKDAMRDCLPAMESLMKKRTDTKNIKAADSKIRDSNWGPKQITGDGIKL